MSKMAFYGYHGVFAEENKLGQQFYVDVELFLPLHKAGISDKLSDTVNYVEIYQLIQTITENQTFQLIETLAEKIAYLVLETYTMINEITVKVCKPHPPFKIFFDGVTVEITRKRD